MADGVQITNTTDATVITVTGCLDESLSPHLEKILDNCTNPVNNQVYIDLQDVSSIKPEGVRVLMKASIFAGENALGLRNPNASVIQLFNTVGLSRLVV